MNRDRLWVIGLGAAIVVVAALGYLAGISPIVAQASAADAQRTSIAAANDASAARLISLKAQYAGIAKLQAQLKVLAGSIPADAEMPVFLRELNALSNQYQVSLKSVAVSVAQNYASPTVTPVKPPAGSAATPSPSPSPSTSTSTSTGAGAGTPAATSAPASRLILIPVAISISGSYSNLMAFVGGLQSGDRLYLLTGLSMSSAADAAHFSADITGYVYALPPAGGTVAKTPAPSGTTTPAPGVSSSATPTPDPSSSPTP